MKKNKNRRSNNYDKKQRKVIRCKLLYQPVFEHEVCSQFISRVSSNNQNNCGNCKHAF